MTALVLQLSAAAAAAIPYLYRQSMLFGSISRSQSSWLQSWGPTCHMHAHLLPAGEYAAALQLYKAPVL
jgi:hypothetical protein